MKTGIEQSLIELCNGVSKNWGYSNIEEAITESNSSTIYSIMFKAMSELHQRLEVSKDTRSNYIYESGIYFGFPKCCITAYIDDILSENYNQIKHRFNISGKNHKGFIPCTQHSIEISTGLVKYEDLIKNRICKDPF